MIETEWVCELCGMTQRPCRCADAGRGAVLSMTKQLNEEAAEESWGSPTIGGHYVPTDTVIFTEAQMREHGSMHETPFFNVSNLEPPFPAEDQVTKQYLDRSSDV